MCCCKKSAPGDLLVVQTKYHTNYRKNDPFFGGKEENECHWHMRQEVVRTATAQMRSTEDMRGRGHVDGNILLLTRGFLYHPIVDFLGRGWNIQDLQMYFLCKLGNFHRGQDSVQPPGTFSKDLVSLGLPVPRWGGLM